MNLSFRRTSGCGAQQNVCVCVCASIYKYIVGFGWGLRFRVEGLRGKNFGFRIVGTGYPWQLGRSEIYVSFTAVSVAVADSSPPPPPPPPRPSTDAHRPSP